MASFSYFWLLHSTSTGKQAERFRAVIDEYGSLARIGPNDLVTDDPDAIRRMGRTNVKAPYARSSWYDSMKMDPYHASLFSTRDTQEHDKLKAKLSFGYAGRENPSLESGIDAQLAAFIDLIRRKYLSVGSNLKPMDMATVVQYYTQDTLTQIAYGNALGYLEHNSDVLEYIAETERVVPGLVMSAEIPWVGRVIMSSTFLRLFGPKATDTKGFGRMLG